MEHFWRLEPLLPHLCPMSIPEGWFVYTFCNLHERGLNMSPDPGSIPPMFKKMPVLAKTIWPKQAHFQSVIRGLFWPNGVRVGTGICKTSMR